jgi:leucyl/phenylalanyl-tRNA---protein transferase
MLFKYNHIDILNAYAQGFFHTLNEHGDFFFFRPKNRPIVLIGNLHVSRTLNQKIKKDYFSVTFDTAFEATMASCVRPVDNWITPESIHVYKYLHRLGFAHSVECWRNNKLVGGLYGLALGSCFFVESMFSIETDSSKVALFHLLKKLKSQNFEFVDFQIMSSHLESMGATQIDNETFQTMLKRSLETLTPWGKNLSDIYRLYEFNFETERLRIRQVSSEDCPNMKGLSAHQEMHRYTLVKPIETDSLFNDYLAKAHRQNMLGVPDGLTILDRTSNKYLGSLSMFYPSRDLPTMEIAIELSPSSWGFGIAKEALSLAINYLSDSYPIYRIQTRVVRENTGSNKLMQSLHFEFEGTQKNSYWFNRLFDLNFYSFSRSQLNDRFGV